MEKLGEIRTAAVRQCIRDVTGSLNQWPIIVSGWEHRLPTDEPAPGTRFASQTITNHIAM
jgi:hypothetical protein